MEITYSTQTEAPYLSIVVPLFNEEESVEELVSNILEAGQQFHFYYEILLIDDGSTDKTWKVIEQLNNSISYLRGIKFRRNFGQTAAMQAGFDHSRGAVIVSLDGDLQNDPYDIPKLLAKISEGYDVVCGWRKDRKDKTVSRIIPSKIANWLIRKTTGVPIHDNGCSLKAYRSSLLKRIRLYSDMHRFIPAVSTIAGARIAEIVVNHRPRKHGKTKYGLSRTWKVLFDMITVKMLIHFRERPISWFAGSGLIFLFLGLGLGIASVLSFIQGDRSIVYPAACFLFISLFGNLLSWGLLAEFFVKIEKR